jgi:hypothetical protein
MLHEDPQDLIVEVERFPVRVGGTRPLLTQLEGGLMVLGHLEVNLVPGRRCRE